jgi:hypothetical protein
VDNVLLMGVLVPFMDQWIVKPPTKKVIPLVPGQFLIGVLDGEVTYVVTDPIQCVGEKNPCQLLCWG